MIQPSNRSCAKFHDLVDQARWYEYRAVIVADDDIIR